MHAADVAVTAAEALVQVCRDPAKAGPEQSRGDRVASHADLRGSADQASHRGEGVPETIRRQARVKP